MQLASQGSEGGGDSIEMGLRADITTTQPASSLQLFDMRSMPANVNNAFLSIYTCW